MMLMSQIATAPFAYAALGDKESQIVNDQQRLHAIHARRTTQALYSVHEINNDNGTIKEFVGPNGTVFAVSWRGTFLPDLKTLFGSYYDQYQVINAARPRMLGRHPVEVKTDQIVVRKGGHMRDVRGIAYIPTQLPAGVQPDDLQ